MKLLMSEISRGMLAVLFDWVRSGYTGDSSNPCISRRALFNSSAAAAGISLLLAPNRESEILAGQAREAQLSRTTVERKTSSKQSVAGNI
jgi:hypothetical protein